MPSYRRYTPEEHARLMTMVEEGLSWPEIGERLGRPGRSAEVRYYNFRSGKIKDRPAYRDRQRRTAIELLKAGKTQTEIAKVLCVSRPAITNLFNRMGFNREVRRLVRKGLPK